MHGKNVALLCELFDRRAIANPKFGGPGGRERTTPRDHMETIRTRARRNLSTNRSKPSNAQRFSVNALRLPELSALPFSRSKRLNGIGDSAIDGANQSKNQLGNSRGVFSRTIRNINSTFARGSNINRAEFCARTHDEVKLSCGVDGRLDDFGGPHHQDSDTVQTRFYRFLGELRFVENFDGKGTELFDGARVQFIGDKKTHGERNPS